MFTLVLEFTMQSEPCARGFVPLCAETPVLLQSSNGFIVCFFLRFSVFAAYRQPLLRQFVTKLLVEHGYLSTNSFQVSLEFAEFGADRSEGVGDLLAPIRI